MNNTRSLQVELAPYKRSLYKDSDRGVIATLLFPMLDSFDIGNFIHTLHDGVLTLKAGDKSYPCVRIHGFEMNQPIRIAYTDYGRPLVIVVLQVYTEDIDTLKQEKLLLYY